MTDTVINENLDMTLYNTYWSKLQQLKFDIEYYDLHFKRCVNSLRIMKYSMASITALATGLWMGFSDNKHLCTICAIVIIACQALSAASEIFPFEKRKLELRELSTELEKLYIKMENDWRNIQSLKVLNIEIQEYIQYYAEKQLNINKNYFKDDALPIIKRIRQKAEELTEEYFINFI